MAVPSATATTRRPKKEGETGRRRTTSNEAPARYEGGSATHRANGEAPTPAVRRRIAAGPTNRAGTKQRKEETRTDDADKGKLRRARIDGHKR